MDNNTPNIADWLQAIATVVTAVLSFLLIVQVYLAKEQIRLGIRWNKLSATFTFFTNEIFVQREHLAAEALRPLDVDLYHQFQPLEAQVVSSVLSDPNKFKEIKSWLNLLEDYAAAVHVGVLDPDSSFAIMADIIVRHFRVFEPLINNVRSEANNVRLWIELEKLALKWSTRRQREVEALEQQLSQVREKHRIEQDKLLKEQGAKKIF